MTITEKLAAYIREGRNDATELQRLVDVELFRNDRFAVGPIRMIVQAIADANRPAAEPELPAVGDAWGNPVDPLNWRVVHFVASGSVQYAEVGNSDILSTMSDSWHEWIAKTGAVNITAKLRESTP